MSLSINFFLNKKLCFIPKLNTVSRLKKEREFTYQNKRSNTFKYLCCSVGSLVFVLLVRVAGYPYTPERTRTTYEGYIQSLEQKATTKAKPMREENSKSKATTKAKTMPEEVPKTWHYILSRNLNNFKEIWFLVVALNCAWEDSRDVAEDFSRPSWDPPDFVVENFSWHVKQPRVLRHHSRVDQDWIPLGVGRFPSQLNADPVRRYGLNL